MAKQSAQQSSHGSKSYAMATHLIHISLTRDMAPQVLQHDTTVSFYEPFPPDSWGTSTVASVCDVAYTFRFVCGLIKRATAKTAPALNKPYTSNNPQYSYYNWCELNFCLTRCPAASSVRTIWWTPCRQRRMHHAPQPPAVTYKHAVWLVQ